MRRRRRPWRFSAVRWLRRYGGDPKVLGQRIPGGPRPEIIGVLAPGLELMFRPAPTSSSAGLLGGESPELRQREPQHVRSAADRMAQAGGDAGQGAGTVESVAAKLRQDFPPQTTAGFYARLEPMHDTLVEEVRPRFSR